MSCYPISAVPMKIANWAKHLAWGTVDESSLLEFFLKCYSLNDREKFWREDEAETYDGIGDKDEGVESRSRTWEKEGNNALGRIEQNLFFFFLSLFFSLFQFGNCLAKWLCEPLMRHLVMCASPSCSSGTFTPKIAIVFEGQLLSNKNCAKISVLVMIQVFGHKIPSY